MSEGTTATRRSGAAGTIDVSPPAAEATDIHVLIIDDSEDDALVAIRELKRGGYSATFERVDTAEAMVSALRSGPWDVIICDYMMPSFSGLAALNVFKASGLDLPFILVSGKVGEERAVEAMRAGATDYVMKDKLNRLVPAIKRELAEVKSRREYRKTAQSLKQSEERYRCLEENYSEVVWVTDMNGQTIYISPSITRLLGYSVEELMAHSTDLTLASLKASINATAQTLSAEQEGKAGNVLGMTPLEVALRHKNGSIAWASTSFSPISDSDGRPIEMMVILHDITAPKKAADILRVSEERLKILFESAPDAYYLSDMEAKLVDGNRAAEELTGYERSELIGQSFLELGLISAEQIPKAAALLSRNIQGQPTGPDEFVLKRKDGSLVNIEINTFPATIDGQRLVLGMIRDITKRRQVTAALQRSEDRFRALVESGTDGILLVDSTGVISYGSPSMTAMLGYEEGSNDGRSMADFVHPDDLPEVVSLFGQLVAHPGGTEHMELRVKHKSGSWKWAEVMGSNLLHDPAVEAIVLNLRDIDDRQKAENALAENEKKYRQLVETLNEGIWAIDKDSNTTFVNPRMAEMLGYTIEEMIGKHLFAFMDERGVEVAKQNLERRQEGIKEQHDFEFLRKDGARVYTSLETSPIIDDKGDYAGAIAGVQDITERRKAEEATRNSETRYRLLAENLSDVIWTMDTNLRYTYLSPSLTSLRGYSVEEAMALSMEETVTPASLQTVLQVMAEVQAKEGTGSNSQPRSATLELELFCKDGSTVWVENRITYLRDLEGRLTGYLGVSRDITERRKAETGLRESEQKFRNLVEATSDWVWEMDKSGAYTYVSRKVRDILGYEVEDLVGKTPFDFMPPNEARRMTKAFKSIVASQKPFAFLENTSRHKDGRAVVLETSGVPFFGDGGVLLGYRGIDRDITERKLMAKQLQASLRKLERTMESTIQAITSTMETRDPYTAGHQKRVSELACAIAKEMGLPDTQIAGIRVAGLLHDIGKISVPTEILSKPGRLTDVEMAMIKTHSRVGHDILKGIEFSWPVARTVLQHHERCDGSGYPAGVRGEALLLEARILSVADVVEAMSSHRPYRPARGIETALEEISRGSGTLYDPEVARYCLKVFADGGFKFELL